MFAAITMKNMIRYDLNDSFSWGVFIIQYIIRD
jgi:hypothetical protein